LSSDPRRKSLRRFCNVLYVVSLLILGVVSLSRESQAQIYVQDRITQPIESANVTALAGSVHPQTRTASEQGMAENTKMLTMSINFKRSAEQQESLNALLAAQIDSASPSYHKWLTQAQFGQQFGMSPDDLAKVSAWLQQAGFTVTSVPVSSNSISFSGNVAAVENAFHTQIHNYSVDGETHFANSEQISIPTALAGLVIGVRGLNDFRLKPKIRFAQGGKTSAVNPHFTSYISGTHYLAPGDIATIYDLNPLTGGAANSWGGTYTGKGVTIGIVGQTDIVLADITYFRSASGLPVNNPTVVTVPGTTPESVAAGAAAGDLDETDLDLEWSGGVGSGASVVLINSNDVSASLQYVIQNPINGITIPIISQSYGACEASYTTSDLNSIETQLQQANAQGQTVILAAGDTGAADCDDNTSEVAATQGLAVDYPGSSPYVTDVGGTEFMGDGTSTSPQTGAGTYWSAAGSGTDTVTSAKSYIPEMVWNDSTVSIDNGGSFIAGGGGVSSLFTKPTWQTGVPGIPADGFRDVPDISLDAALYHDAYLYCTQVLPDSTPGTYASSCTPTSFRLSDPGQQDNLSLLGTAGGTSFAAPSFAGILSIIEQKLGSGALGNINPSLYTLAANATTYASAFHDITVGNNDVPCVTGSPNCPTGSNPMIGYSAGTGYDQATGLGSLDANNLATAFTNLVAATGTKTTLTASPGTSAEINQKVTFTATVTPNTLSSAPAGTVTFTVDGVAQTPAADLTATGSTYTATLTYAFAQAGTHTVVATFTSTNSTYTGSNSTAATVSVVAQGASVTTTTVTANPTSVQLGASITFTAVVTGTSGSAGTLTGPMTFSIAGTTVGKVSQVTIGANNTATATLTVTSAASLGFTAGTDTVTASYGGDSYNATSSGTTTITVTNPGITVTATNITISSPNPGNSATSTVTLTSTGGYAGNAVVSATGNFTAQASFGSSGSATGTVTLAANGTGTTTLTITTLNASGNLRNGPTGNLRKAVAGGTALGCLFLLLVPGIRRKRWPAALVMLVFLSVGAGIGCGGGSGGGAPAGTYSVTVTAQDSSNANITGSGTFTVTIQ
jgi:Pro-kumamolisin, activation domain/Bacterial Ig-like domain (group 3)